MTVFIVDEIKSVVDKVNTALTNAGFKQEVNYMYGHPKEISKRLQELSKSISQGVKKFPLIILFTDITINHETPGYYGSTRLRMLVCNITEPTYISEQRTELNFKPVLHPIKEELIKQISVHGNFSFQGELKFSETDMYYYGSELNDKNVFNDYIDAIELRDIRLNINNICS